MLLIVVCFLNLAYACLMLLYRAGWKRQPVAGTATASPAVPVSVIIPARNEAAHIAACVDSILAQDYPEALLEIIVIDDHSTDDTARIVASYNNMRVRCLKLADHLQPGERLNAYKKKALSIGIAHSSGQLIVTTDADCVAEKSWLKMLNACWQQQRPAMIVAPVDFTCNGSIVELLQAIDFMSMQGITAAAHALKLGTMSNGANLAFEHSAFEEVGGYRGIDHLASGDDYLLLLKMQDRFPDRIRYLKAPGAIVHTDPQPDWGSFLQQRIRWASKSGKYKDHRMTAILLLVYLYNCSFPVLLVAALFHPVLWGGLAGSLVLKTAVELCFLWPVAGFFRKRSLLRYHPWLQPVHIAYIILAGFLGMIGQYRWKERKVK